MTRVRLAHIAVVALVAFFAASCKTKQPLVRMLPVVGHKSPQAVLEAQEANKFRFNTLSMKASTSFTANDKTQSFKAAVRIQKDSCIWISVSLVGVEAARALITPDTVKVLDRLKKVAVISGTNGLDSIADIEMDFETLQALIVGNMVPLEYKEKVAKDERKELRAERKEERKEEKEERKELRDQGQKPEKDRKDRERRERERKERVKVSFDKGRYLVSTYRKARLRKAIEKDKIDLGEEIVFSGWLDAETFKLNQLYIIDFSTNKQLQATYSQFETHGDQQLPTHIDIKVLADQEANINVKYSRIKVNEKLNFPFRIPSRFKVIESFDQIPDGTGATGPQ